MTNTTTGKYGYSCSNGHSNRRDSAPYDGCPECKAMEGTTISPTKTLSGLLEHPWPEQNDFGRGYEHLRSLIKDAMEYAYTRKDEGIVQDELVSRTSSSTNSTSILNRESFEKWASPEDYDLTWNEKGWYYDSETRNAYAGWLASLNNREYGEDFKRLRPLLTIIRSSLGRKFQTSDYLRDGFDEGPQHSDRHLITEACAEFMEHQNTIHAWAEKAENILSKIET